MKKDTWRRVVGTVVLVALVGGFAAYTARAQSETESKPVMVINLTAGKEDPHAATMALELAGHGLADGREVIVFLNVRAPELASRNLPTSCGLVGKPTVRELMAGLLQKGATFLSCPSCMEVLGVKPADLVSGVELASREGLFGKLGADAVVFSY